MKLRALAVAALALASTAAGAAGWKPVEGGLLTRWAHKVNPARPLPEYPRPQMVRKDWLNLNGLWQFEPGQQGQPAPVGRSLSGTILVPFAPESALSGVKKHFDRVWYRRTFEVPKAWAGRRVLLHFGAVDWEADVWLNGRKLLKHRGGYDPFWADVTDWLKGAGKQELVVGVHDPTDTGDQPRGKQVINPNGIWYTPITGIWQTVWLEPVSRSYIAHYRAVPDIGANVVRVKASVVPENTAPPVTVTVLDGAKVVGKATGSPESDIVVKVPNAKRWSPSSPFLYGLRITCGPDTVRGYFGMRGVKVGKAPDGRTRVLLNGKPLFMLGPLDQGFWPDGLYTAPTDDALRWDIEATKKLGFNCTRKHVKVEPARWYYWCDKLGLPVWQDMPSGNNRTSESRKQFEAEWRSVIVANWNSPSVIAWIPFNEGWGQYDTERITQWTRAFDPSRLVNNASGWTDHGVGDVNDWHRYPEPDSPRPEPTRAAMLGEFGGLGLFVQGHLWNREARNWSYSTLRDGAAFTSRYVRMLRRAYALNRDPGLSVAIYTQITDVEGELNGLITYDREVFKGDWKAIARANRGIFPPMAPTVTLLPTSEREPRMWRFTTARPADDWAAPDFDDSAWDTGPGAFSERVRRTGPRRSLWNASDIWVRQEFSLASVPHGRLKVLLQHDDDAEVYVNGVRALVAEGANGGYDEFDAEAAAARALRQGRNVIAVHCRNTGGVQYLDAGLFVEMPLKK